MRPEFWAIVVVGVALTAVGVTVITLGWSMYAGRFREEAAS